jgi:hypothetical protein
MDTHLLPYRLKSARRKRRLLIKDRDKQLLKLDRERERISKDPDYLTTVPLDEPYQKGWKRLFVLKPEVAKSDKAEFYEEILYWINSVQLHYDRSFKNSKRAKRWHRYYHNGPPQLQRLSYARWHKGDFKLSEAQCACFKLAQFWNEAYNRWDYGYEFMYPWVFKIAVLPHMITSIQLGDALLAQRMAWIDDQFYKNGGIYRLDKLQNGNRYKNWKINSEKLKYINPLKNKARWDWEEE